MSDHLRLIQYAQLAILQGPNDTQGELMASGKHRVVVVGGSFGSVNAAYQLRRNIRDRIDVTLISIEADFTFIPSLPWVMMGWRKSDAIKVSLVGMDATLSAPGGRLS